MNTLQKDLTKSKKLVHSPLPSHILKNRNSLSEKPSPIILRGQFVLLEPLVIERDALPLFEMSNGNAIQLGKRSMEAYDADELIWCYMFDGPFKTMNEFSASLKLQINAPNGRCICVFDVATGRQVGVANFMNNVPSHLKIELGGIWYSPISKGHMLIQKRHT